MNTAVTLEQMQAEAAQIDAAAVNAATPQLPDAAPAPSLNEAFKPMIMKFLGFCTRFVDEKIPFTTKHFTPEALEAIADSLIKVGDIEGVDLGALIGDPDSRLGAWLSLAFAVGAPSFTFYIAIVEYRKQLPKPAAETEKPAPLKAEPKPNEMQHI